MPKTPENTGGARAPLWHRVWHRLSGKIWENMERFVHERENEETSGKPEK